MKPIMRMLLALSLFTMAASAVAEDLLMVRSRQPFAETMLTLQEAIGTQGYVVSRVQRVDIGLTEFGYQTDKYRVVFFGKPEEIRDLSARYPQLIPYLPLKIAIFAEGAETLLAASNPEQLASAYAEPELDRVFARWAADMRTMFETVRQAE